MSIAFVVVGVILLTGCSSHGPTRIRCERDLEPINPPGISSPAESAPMVPVPIQQDRDPPQVLGNSDGR